MTESDDKTTAELAAELKQATRMRERIERATVEPITDRDMKIYIMRALSGEPADTFDARVEAIFTALHTTYGLIDLDRLMPETFWANVERVDAQLAATEIKIDGRVQRRGEEGPDHPIGVVTDIQGDRAMVAFSGLFPVSVRLASLVVAPKSLYDLINSNMLELIKVYGLAKYNHGGAFHSDATVRVVSDYMIEASALETEIVRRLELIQRYSGTEASNIKAILQTGRPLDGWLRDEADRAYRAEQALRASTAASVSAWTSSATPSVPNE